MNTGDRGDLRVEIPVETPYGTARLTVTSSEHIYVQANGWIVNRVPVRASQHLIWNRDSKVFEATRESGALYAYRLDKGLNCSTSRSVDQKIAMAFSVAVNTWASSNRDALERAEYAHLKTRLQAKEKDLNDVHQKVRDLRREVEELKTEVYRRMPEGEGGVL